MGVDILRESLQTASMLQLVLGEHAHHALEAVPSSQRAQVVEVLQFMHSAGVLNWVGGAIWEAQLQSYNLDLMRRLGIVRTRGGRVRLARRGWRVYDGLMTDGFAEWRARRGEK